MNVNAENNPEQSGAIATPSTSKIATSNAHISHSNLTNDPDIERDAEFSDKFQEIMTDNIHQNYLSFTYHSSEQGIRKLGVV